MNNDDIYLRKDVYKGCEDAIYIAINDLRDRIDDLNNHINRILTISGVILTAITILVPVILVYLNK